MAVVPFPQEKKRLWVCGCGCSTFSLMEGGLVECAACGDSEPSGGWWEPPDDGGEWEGGTPISDVQGNGSVEFAKRRMAQMAADSDVQMLVVAKDDGAVRCWFSHENEEQAEWMAERLDLARAMLDGQTV